MSAGQIEQQVYFADISTIFLFIGDDSSNGATKNFKNDLRMQILIFICLTRLTFCILFLHFLNLDKKKVKLNKYK